MHLITLYFIYILPFGGIFLNCYFATFGCKVNTYETACMQALFAAQGDQTVQRPEEADVIVVNSCTVTASGDSRVQTALRKLRRSAPDAVLVLTGCFAQAFPQQAAALPEADIVLGTKNRSQICKLVQQYFAGGHQSIFAVSDYQEQDDFELMTCETIPNRTRAFVKIQDGCNCFCSYCIIPYARGRCRSKPKEALRQEAAALAAAGYRELVLCGINLAFYGTEWGGTLLEAVRICCETEGIARVRLGSLEPEQLTDSDLAELAAQPKFCPQFHLSLQSGCDRTLAAMNRNYTCAEYADLCKRIRRIFPDCAITTDIMVGFPGETQQDFAESLAFAEWIGFAKLHVFRYSPRPGTPAAARTDQVPDAMKHQRMEQMQALGERMQKAFLQAQIGKTVPVLFERERGDGFHVGHAPNSTVIKIPEKNQKKSLRKQIFYVKIEESDAACCYGQILSNGAENPG